MRISIFGIGYVGAVTAACLARDGHTVIAVDTDEAKVTALNAGRAPMSEKGLDDLIREAVAGGILSATHDAVAAIKETDVTIVCVGTPAAADGSIDLTYVKAACSDIGRAMKKKKDYHTVVLRSTMLPGSAQYVCLPLIEETSKKKAGKHFGFGNSPEFLREGTAIADYYSPPKIVVGAFDEQSGKTIMSLYERLDAPRIITTVRIAEAVKYADNAWHAMKVGFANEMGNIFKAAGVDSHRVMDIFCMDEKLNISRAYLKPGFAYGGSCLPKDVNALRSLAEDKGIETPILNSLTLANQKQIDRAVSMVRATGRRKIAILGLTFKPGTDDLRDSPMVMLAGQLINEGYDLKIYDPVLSMGYELAGPLASHLVINAHDVHQGTEVFVVGHNTSHFRDILSRVDNDDIPIIDLVRVGGDVEERKNYDGICW